MYTVSDLMTREVLSLKEADDLSLADSFLRLGRIRHLPVTDDEGRLLGLVTHRDLVRCQVVKGEHAGRAVLARDVMNTSLSTVSPDTPLREALERMLRHKFGCLPVVDEEHRLVGILTEADLVRFAAEVVGELDKASSHFAELREP